MKELTESQKQSYTELEFVLNHLEKDLRKKIPKKFLEFVEECKDKKFNVEYDFDLPLKDQKFHKETFSLLSVVFVKYFCETKQEKIDFLEKTMKNKLKEQ